MKIRTKSIKNLVFTVISLSFMAIIPVSSANADIVAHLYEVEVPVEGQGRKERAYVVREALKEILVRVSGRNEANALAADENLVPRPTRYIQQFRYRKFKSNEVIPKAPDGAKPYTQKLWLRFTEKTIAKLLRGQGFPVWGKTRPATLVWLVVDDKKQRTLISNSSSHISRAYIEEEATKRGLPFRLPLLDLADQSKIQASDIWGNFEDTILEASLRYQAQAILVGRIYLGYANTWNTRWSLYSAGQRQDWDGSSSEVLRSAVNEGLSKTAEVLSVRFTQVNVAEEGDSVLLQIKNVSSLKAYNKVIKYLKGLNIVTQFQMLQVNKDNVIFRINSRRNGRLGVAQALDLGHVLVDTRQAALPTESVEDKQGQIKTDLIYKLVL